MGLCVVLKIENDDGITESRLLGPGLLTASGLRAEERAPQHPTRTVGRSGEGGTGLPARGGQLHWTGVWSRCWSARPEAPVWGSLTGEGGGPME